MNELLRASVTVALVTLGGCTTPQQLADEGRLLEATLALDPDDDDAKEHVAQAIARATRADAVLYPLDDEELFAALGFVPERFASEEALLVYWRTNVTEAPGARPGVVIGPTGYYGSLEPNVAVQPPPDAPGNDALTNLFRWAADKLLPGVRESLNRFTLRRSAGPDPDVQRRLHAEQRLRHVLSLGERSGPRTWGFQVVSRSQPPGDEALALFARVWTEWDGAETEGPIMSPLFGSIVELTGTAPAAGARERLNTFFAQGPLTLQPDALPTWERDESQAQAVTDERRRAVLLTADPESYFERGVRLALTNERPRARADFTRAVELGGPHVARSALWAAAMGEPMTGLERHATAGWPGPICRLFLAQTTLDQLLVEARCVADERERRGRECEAHAYAGLLAELNGDLAAGLPYYRAAVETQRVDLVEFAWAEARLAGK